MIKTKSLVSTKRSGFPGEEAGFIKTRAYAVAKEVAQAAIPAELEHFAQRSGAISRSEAKTSDAGIA